MVACWLPVLSTPDKAASTAPMVLMLVVVSLVVFGAVVVMSGRPKALAVALLALVTVVVLRAVLGVPVSAATPASCAAMVVSGLMFKVKLVVLAPGGTTPTANSCALRSTFLLLASLLKSTPVLLSTTLATTTPV